MCSETMSLERELLLMAERSAVSAVDSSESSLANRQRSSERHHLPAQEKGDSCQRPEDHGSGKRRKLALPGMED